MNKKNIRRRVIEIEDEGDGPISSNLLQVIQKKLESSAALNGGFDRLLYKIDSIEQSQNQIVEKVDKIHEAIYNPDDGLFSRISANKASQIELISNVEKKVVELDAWRQQTHKDEENCEKENDEIQLKLQEIENSIKNINNFQSNIFSMAKWLGAALGGGVISLLFKFLMLK